MSAGPRMRLYGADAFKARVRRAIDDGPEVLRQANKEFAEEVVFPMTQAQVPEDTGLLASTGAVVDWGRAVAIVYGPGGAEDYAWVQHERTDFHHPKPGAKAKYVEDPVKAAAGMMARQLADRISARDLFGG